MNLSSPGPVPHRQFMRALRGVPVGRLLDAGFDFMYPEWGGAAVDLVRRAGTPLAAAA